ncbi:gamma-glutamylcyclotransferase family protein [Pseudoalteromonas sp. R3]|jgi:cation transport regulator ChaC|uniref:gamma-glutamylcyclotransferase family protein n=1 Tax=Pseudoalteromonas sp. R3 TaxID=1709477 RepID=UPI0006B62AA8|nr:gamma-glutamylcyclotransferase family protein [Pseudoalteromonas sp. R3]AZZ97416.1 gamma-glutamylcyclotransferase [Pseudoalteromonas sp. R3]
MFNYFAYGSCMNFKSLSETIQENAAGIFAGAFMLPKYDLLFNYPSTNGLDCFLNIEANHTAQVWGGVFKINDSQLNQIRVREAFFKNRYAEKEVQLIREDGKEIRALTYIANYTTPEEGNPGSRYAALVKQGLKDCQLPDHYRQKIEDKIFALTSRIKD